MRKPTRTAAARPDGSNSASARGVGYRGCCGPTASTDHVLELHGTPE